MRYINQDRTKQSIELKVGTGEGILPIPDFKEMVFGENPSETPIAELYGQSYDDIKVTVEKEDPRRTFSLYKKEPQMYRRILPKNPRIVIEDGHPTPETISPITRKFMNDLLTKNKCNEISLDPLL